MEAPNEVYCLKVAQIQSRLFGTPYIWLMVLRCVNARSQLYERRGSMRFTEHGSSRYYSSFHSRLEEEGSGSIPIANGDFKRITIQWSRQLLFLKSWSIGSLSRMVDWVASRASVEIQTCTLCENSIAGCYASSKQGQRSVYSSNQASRALWFFNPNKKLIDAVCQRLRLHVL